MNFQLNINGFKKVEESTSVDSSCTLLLKRQNLNLNRAIAVFELDVIPESLEGFILKMRTQVAKKVKFVPFFWGVGIQIIIVCPNIVSEDIDPNKFVSRVDNQWAIVQSVFLVDRTSKKLKEGRTWGQVISKKFQDEISVQLKAVLK